MPRRLARAAKRAIQKNVVEAKRRSTPFYDSPKPLSISHAPTQPKHGFPTRVFRTVPGKYFDWKAAYDNSIYRDPDYFSFLRASRERGRTFQQRVPHLIGTGVLIEICEKEKGKPDFLMFVRRSRNLVVLPGLVTLPGGSVEPAELPHENVLQEMSEEFGIRRSKIKFVGPGLAIQKNQQNPLALTTVVDEATANQSITYIIRINASQTEMLNAFRTAKSRWEADGVLFVPRNPKAIARFLRRHKKNFWGPQAVKRYLTELMPDWRRKLK